MRGQVRREEAKERKGGRWRTSQKRRRTIFDKIVTSTETCVFTEAEGGRSLEVQFLGRRGSMQGS